jgi:hypothetical protein
MTMVASENKADAATKVRLHEQGGVDGGGYA